MDTKTLLLLIAAALVIWAILRAVLSAAPLIIIAVVIAVVAGGYSLTQVFSTGQNAVKRGAHSLQTNEKLCPKSAVIKNQELARLKAQKARIDQRIKIARLTETERNNLTDQSLKLQGKIAQIQLCNF